jgi:hypothetical protein
MMIQFEKYRVGWRLLKKLRPLRVTPQAFAGALLYHK